MAITTQGLIKLGFDKYTDFVLEDASDGNGVYIAQWNSDKPQPSEADITTAHAEWEAEYDSQQYARDRASAYPSLTDQADMQYWDSVNGTTTWVDSINEIKSQFPKG
jgi:hypothetical protein